jgi:anti-sigma B factor antagonist
MPHELVMRGNIAVIQCHGRLVVGETNELRDLVQSAINENHQVILNMSDVPLIDSTGLGMLAVVCMSARKRGLDVKLVAPSAYVADVLETTMLGSVFKVFSTDDEALKASATKE